MDDSALLKSAQKLDQKALVAIFDKYAPAIYQYCFCLGHDPVESDEIVGDVFKQLLEKLTAGEGLLTSLRCYLYQITYRRLIDHVHYRQQVVKLEIVTKTGAELDVSSTPSKTKDQFLTERLLSVLNTDLSEIQQHIILLRFLEDFSPGEISVILGKNVKNIKANQRRGIAKLRKCLGL